MKKISVITMKILTLLIGLSAGIDKTHAQHGNSSIPHEMQHGFILAADDQFASHLVATRHHSRQAEITGKLLIHDLQEMKNYQDRKMQSAGSSYFLFQAQNLDLPTLSDGQVLTGHIVESRLGNYEPENIIVGSATFQVQKVLLNISNPFFNDKTHQKKNDSNLSDILNQVKSVERHCCETGKKPCWWKC